MHSRIDTTKYRKTPASLAMSGLQQAVEASGLEHSLLELIKIRASQINGCAFCIDMHTKDARQLGETEQRIYALSAWREAPFFTPRERAALEWAESLTQIADSHVPDDVYERVRQELKEEELVSLSYAVVAINGWNRLAVGFRMQAGTYQPAAAAAEQK
jgi:AhpD family alkylhydroperoxidase